MVFPRNLKEGAKFRTICSVTGRAPFTFKWQKNGQGLPQDDQVTTENAQDYSILAIKKLRKSHAGNYTCIAMNRGGATRQTSELIVNAPPAWTIEPTSGVVLLGSKLELECQSHGYPDPTVTWTKAGAAGGQVISGTVNGTLRIQNASKTDGGRYVCTAANRHGERIEKEVEVRVIVPARFEEKFKVQTVRRGEAATLQCQALGDSPMEITWSQDKKRLIFAPVTRYEKFESNTENGVASELVIPTTDRSDAALYTCVAKNEYGSDERNIKLLVVEVPSQPLDLRILEVWSRKVNVIWSEPYSGNSPINNYIVHYWRDKDGAHRLMEQSVPSSQTSAMISELHPGASYSLTVTAENEVGQGPPSDPVRFLTAEEEPGGSPTDVWAAAKGPTSIAVSWKPPPRDTWNGVLKGYYVGYRAADSSQQPYSFKTVETVVNGSQEVTLVGLTKSSRYSVIVKAFNTIGSGPPSEALLVRTLDGDVPLPPALTLISSTDSAFKVKWTHSKATVAPVTGYTLHYKKNAGPWHHIPVVASDDTSYTLTDLDGGATYKVYLTASNQFGRGSGSEAIIINTTNHGYDRNWVFYKDPSLLVPAASFLIAILVVITVVTVCIKKTKAHKNFEKSLEAEKRQSYGEVTQQQQRYIDVTEKRNRSDYATIQSRRSLSGSYKIEELRSAARNRGYNTTDAKDRRRSSLRKSSASSHVYDSAA
ncbi:cell adhesion molecule Dscam1 isoform X4 [Rhipicephalus microplus]|uniref:cell adhesion molecule Dscam1 isoform X4 n=1 Tax=Rhipicephalus microplus TaxID=6941 RepID=UPI003F6C3D2B